MTLNELIESLEALRRACPASGEATVDEDVVEPSYDHGTVFLGIDHGIDDSLDYDEGDDEP